MWMQRVCYKNVCKVDGFSIYGCMQPSKGFLEILPFVYLFVFPEVLSQEYISQISYLFTKMLSVIYWLGSVVHACIPSTLGGLSKWTTRSGDWNHPRLQGESQSLLKIQKISWAWWHVPVIPATQEAEAGELPEPRRWRLQWAEIMPLHSSPGNKSETPSQKKKRKKKIFLCSVN